MWGFFVFTYEARGVHSLFKNFESLLRRFYSRRKTLKISPNLLPFQ